MNALMREYVEKWYVLAVCAFLVLPGMSAGFMVVTAIWGYEAMSSISIAEFAVFGLVSGVVSTLPIQLLHLIMYRRGVRKPVLIAWSLAWLLISTLIGVIILLNI